MCHYYRNDHYGRHDNHYGCHDDDYGGYYEPWLNNNPDENLMNHHFYDEDIFYVFLMIRCNIQVR